MLNQRKRIDLHPGKQTRTPEIWCQLDGTSVAVENVYCQKKLFAAQQSIPRLEEVGMTIERIEVFLDGASTPIQRLEHPPYQLALDTTTLDDGAHELRVVTTYTNGQHSQRRISFGVQNAPALGIQGLEDGALVRGTINLGFGEPQLINSQDSQGSRGSNVPAWLYPLASVAVLGGVWAFFAFVMGAGGGGVDAAVLSSGKAVYTANCAGCHGGNGEGTPDFAPPFAKNPHLEDPGHVITAVVKGLSGGVEVLGKKYTQPMPALAQLSHADVAAVVTFVRNSLGNGFGGVTTETEVKAKR
jgi:mono/diheme cytochrome c family protein